ncbi:hypothetical protein MLD38_031263 [Melastoma candidum]|uniref:Uncharacterized protein n=1 Tax=Melastoma candidum TaxID=119954 RepID=A0ACB9MR86_9MYRT|nr:hypothetical protein MLD38_031263 [Melastoma candidum]
MPRLRLNTLVAVMQAEDDRWNYGCSSRRWRRWRMLVVKTTVARLDSGGTGGVLLSRLRSLAETVEVLAEDGSYIAHKEAGLLRGVVDRIGERVKLEWRHTYRSVWVRRVNKWTCYPKPDHQDDSLNRNEVPVICTDLALPALSVRKRARDWIMRESRERKRQYRLWRMVRPRRMMQVKEVGVQADPEMDNDWSGMQTGHLGNQVETRGEEMTIYPGSQAFDTTRTEFELMDEDPMDWGPGAWYCRDVELPSFSTGCEGSTLCERMQRMRILPKNHNLIELAEKFLQDLAKEEDQIARILKCQALRLIAGKLDGTSVEFKDIISELNLISRNNVNRERFVSFERGIGDTQEWDRFNDEAMARFRTQVRREAALNRMNERISALLLRTELSGKRTNWPLKQALKRCFKAWRVAARLKIEELRYHIQGWERRMVKMEALAYKRMRPQSTNLYFVLQDNQEESEEVDPTKVEPAPLSFKEALEPTTSAIIDSRRPRPPALTSSMVRKTMVRLELIEQEVSPMLRLKQCRELRQMLNGLDGVPAHIGDLHEELYTLALMEVPDGNWLPDPVIPASPSSGTSSADADLWLDELWNFACRPSIFINEFNLPKKNLKP